MTITLNPTKIGITAFILPTIVPRTGGATSNTTFTTKTIASPSSSSSSFTQSTSRRTRAPVSPTKRRCLPQCNSVPDSPYSLVQSWQKNRSIASTLDLSRRFVSVLFLSNHCQRACVAEKTLGKLAEHYAISRRLLILSAGIYSKPGDLLPLGLVSAARDRNIDLSDERPCASFEISDLDYYDFVVVVDRDVRDKLMSMAEASAHTSGGHLYEWERKIRLLCDFDGSVSVQSSGMRGAQPLDVPKLESASGFTQSMDIIAHGCEHVICSFLAAGL